MGKSNRIKVPKGKGDEIETPPWLFKWLNDIFSFTHDAACTRRNALAEPIEDSLDQNWGLSNYLNPPYSNPAPFLAKAREEQLQGKLTVALVNGDPSTRWWQTYVEHQPWKLFIPFRVRHYYLGKPTADVARFPSAVVVFLPLGGPIALRGMND